MDNAFPTHPFPGYTTAELETFVADRKSKRPAEKTARMKAEIARRKAVEAGDESQMTPADRLRHAQGRARIAAAPDLLEVMKPFAAMADEYDHVSDADADDFLIRSIGHGKHAVKLTLTDLRRARAALSRATGEGGN